MRPRSMVRHEEEFRRLHTIRRADAPIVRWLSRRPDAQRQMNWQAEQRGQDLQVLSAQAAETLDQPAHRSLLDAFPHVEVVLLSGLTPASETEATDAQAGSARVDKSGRAFAASQRQIQLYVNQLTEELNRGTCRATAGALDEATTRLWGR